MSSSDDEVPVAKTNKNSKKEAKTSTAKVEFQIKPSKGGPSLDTSTWPLLLKVMKPYINILSPGRT